LLFSDERKIEAGRRYSIAEFEQFPDKYFFVEIPINNRRLGFYRIYDNASREFRFRIDKIVVLQDESGNYLDIVGINWPDNEIYNTTFIDDNNCVVKVQFDDVPIMRFFGNRPGRQPHSVLRLAARKHSPPSIPVDKGGSGEGQPRSNDSLDSLPEETRRGSRGRFPRLVRPGLSFPTPVFADRS
jgi:hypothetical protein